MIDPPGDDGSPATGSASRSAARTAATSVTVTAYVCGVGGGGDVPPPPPPPLLWHAARRLPTETIAAKRLDFLKASSSKIVSDQ